MKILLIGKTGQLGTEILRHWKDHDVVAPDRAELDIRDRSQIQAALARHQPEVVINTAASHNVPRCEDEPELAFRVNCVAVRDLARCCSELGARLVTFSTDYVFDGEKRSPYVEDDLPHPLQVYGITRLAGELAARAAHPLGSVVIRTAGLYGQAGAASKGGNFVDQRLKEAQTLSRVEMGCDQTVSPTSAHDLCLALLSLVQNRQSDPGIYHLANQGECTWYEFTRAIYQMAGWKVEVIPVDRGGRSGSMRRPLYSALGSIKTRTLGIVMPPWRDALERYLSQTPCASP